eukprot:PhF_6_TR35781/c0_g1_i2/m.52000
MSNMKKKIGLSKPPLSQRPVESDNLAVSKNISDDLPSLSDCSNIDFLKDRVSSEDYCPSPIPSVSSVEDALKAPRVQRQTKMKGKNNAPPQRAPSSDAHKKKSNTKSGTSTVVKTLTKLKQSSRNIVVDSSVAPRSTRQQKRPRGTVN